MYNVGGCYGLNATPADGDDILQSSDVGFCLEAHANDEVAAIRINK